MTNRENQKRLDRLAMKYLHAVEYSDFDTIDELWMQAEGDAELGEMLHDLNAELAADQDAEQQSTVEQQVVSAIEKHLPSAEIIRSAHEPVTVAEVAEHIRKHPPHGLTADDLRMNDVLRALKEDLPKDLGAPEVAAWGRRFGAAPEAYWKAFRAVALKLRMQRESAENYQMAARPAGKPKPTEGSP